jgi:hypothetical protein
MSSHHSTSDDRFFLIVSGPATQTPFLSTWQAFKDNIRKSVEQQPKWVEVDRVRNQTNRGYAEVQNGEDGESAFRKLDIESSNVHTADTVEPGTFSKMDKVHVHLFIDRQRSRQVLSCSRATPCQCVDITTAPSTTAPPRITLHPMALHSSHYSPHCLPTSHYLMNPAISKPVYGSDLSGLRVNIRSGGFLTEARSVFIGNLSFGCTPTDLVQLLSTIANPVDWKFINNPRTGVFKGCATASFSTAEAAAAIVDHLNGTKHMGMPLRIRFDKEPTILPDRSLLIVDSRGAIL